jgi:hypothetical protein
LSLRFDGKVWHMLRLSNLSPRIVTALEKGGVDLQKFLAVRSCEISIASQSSPIREYLQVVSLLINTRTVPSEYVDRVEYLATQFDQRYFELIDTSDESDKSEEFFSKARLGFAIVFAARAVDVGDYSDAIYEAAMSTGEPESFIDLLLAEAVSKFGH